MSSAGGIIRAGPRAGLPGWSDQGEEPALPCAMAGAAWDHGRHVGAVRAT